jgi:hypothetical protein
MLPLTARYFANIAIAASCTRRRRACGRANGFYRNLENRRRNPSAIRDGGGGS